MFNSKYDSVAVTNELVDFLNSQGVIASRTCSLTIRTKDGVFKVEKGYFSNKHDFCQFIKEQTAKVRVYDVAGNCYQYIVNC